MEKQIVIQKKTKVLVVDDDFSFSFLVAESLLKQGFDVYEVDNGIECLEMLDEILPDLIILDVIMPIQDGYVTCQEIRSQANFKLTPILMMTGLEDEASIQAAYLSGATDFIAKPFNFSLFLQRVSYILRNSQITNDLIRSQRRLTEANKLAKFSYWDWDFRSEEFVWSESILNTLRLEPKDLKNTYEFLLERTPQSDKPMVQEWIKSAFQGRGPEGITHRIISGAQETLYILQQVSADFDESGSLTHLNGSLLDVTEMHQAQEKIRRLAYYDSLTELPNRAYFRELLSHTIRLADRGNRIAALLFIDLDNFKRVNDTLGHSSGDLLLKAVTQRIKGCLRASDVVSFESDGNLNQLARLGGDEFTLLLPEISSADGAAVVAQRLIDAFSIPFNLDGTDVIATPSIGISVFPDDAKTAEECLYNSDIAMHHAKLEGKNQYRFFNHEMGVEIQERMKLDYALHTALNSNEFRLVYQPQIELESGEMSGVEALIRWHSPSLGFVPPDKFISLAEENGTIIQIGEWVLREACKQAKEWIDKGVKLKRVAVNVSARQFAQPNFKKVVTSILEETGLPANMLDLEMTEGMLMSHAAASLEMLKKLKAIGVGISIDDFGTGYSSLAYLSQFPIDHLKIDKSFIDNVDSNQNNSVIISAIIAMANAMGMRVTSEGVETNEQLAYLKKQLCSEVQGYFFSKPLSPNEIYQFATKNHP
jgi:diguanylate cyclase (GGDEF)-like protein